MSAQTELKLNALLDYIDGKWSAPNVNMGTWIHNPNNNTPLQPQLATEENALEQALETAARVHQSGIWANMPHAERAALLNKVADELDKHQNEMAFVESLTTGVILSLTKMLCRIPAMAFRQAAEQLESEWTNSTLPGHYGAVEVLRRPWGPAALIAPWNAPAPIAAHKLANALAAGCTAILKPSEWAPHSCGILAQAVEAAGLPNGVFQMVHGGASVGARLVEDKRIRAVSFTGGLKGGRAVAAACAVDFKPAQLELGGNNAFVVMEDADLEQAASGVISALTTLNGQWCRALGRLIVHERLADALLEQTLDKLASLKIGDSLDEETEMGPLIHKGHLGLVQQQRDMLIAKGGKAHSRSFLPNLEGYFIAPTLISGVPSEDSLEEIFGPVATIHPFKTEDEAVMLANHPPYGLGGNVYGKNEERALQMARQMQTGGVKVNGVGLIGLHPLAPRPAWGLSGFGEEGTLETFRFFCGTRVIGIAGR